MDAGKDDHLMRKALSEAAEIEGVSPVVGDVLDLGGLVIVGQDDCPPLLFQLFDVLDEFTLGHG